MIYTLLILKVSTAQIDAALEKDCLLQTNKHLSGEASYDISFLHFDGPHLATLANEIQVAICYDALSSIKGSHGRRSRQTFSRILMVRRLGRGIPLLYPSGFRFPSEHTSVRYLCDLASGVESIGKVLIFFAQDIHPDKPNCNAVNELTYAARSWHALLPRRQHEIRQGTRFSDLNPTDPDPEPLSLVQRVDTDDNDGRFTLMLFQHPLLGQSPAARRAMLYEWYYANAFTAQFDLCMTSANRSELEQALELLGPRLTACIITPMAGVIEPRLYIHFGDVETSLTFTSLLQWFRLF